MMGEVRAREREFEILFLLNVELFLYHSIAALRVHWVYLHFDLRLSQTADRGKHTLKKTRLILLMFKG